MMIANVKPLGVFLQEYTAKATEGHKSVQYPTKKEYKAWKEHNLKLFKIELEVNVK